MFTVSSVILIALSALVIGSQLAKAIRYNMINSYALSIGTQASSAVNAFLLPEDLKEPFTGDKHTDFKQHVEKVTAGTSVEQVKLWSTDGVVLFSLDKSIVGKRFSDNHDLEEASEGEPVVEISDLEDDEHSGEAEEHERLLEMYYPVTLDAGVSGRVDAVYEVYISVVPVEEHVNSTLRALAFAMAALTLLLIALAQFASRMLRRRNDRLAELSAMLERKADTDGLTGLYNHRPFQSFLENQTTVADRYDKQLGLIILDLDFFKTVNDRFGHQIGDKVLKKVAGVFDEVLRDADYAARYGGEEFVVVLPETDARGAVRLAERLREAMEALQIDVEGVSKQPRITVSCGVAEFPDCADNRESLIAAADSALLFAKKKGRNRVCFFPEISEADFEEGDLDKLISRLPHASMPPIQALVAAVGSNDSYDQEHSHNLVLLAAKFNVKLDMPKHHQHALKIAAQVHDIGKAVIAGRHLGRNEALTESEVEAIRTHPEAGAKIVETAAQTENLLSAILHHHENWDGTGHPDGLKGAEIPYLARVLRVLNAYESMISDQHPPALSPDQAIAELHEKAGTEFDPNLITVFVECLESSSQSPPQKDLSTA